MKCASLYFSAIAFAATILLSGCGGGNDHSVECADGWISPSGGSQGACSSHGGIKK
jgi:hypothetical protein